MATSHRDVPGGQFDPTYGDVALAEARRDLVFGRWQGACDLIRASGQVWDMRTHRVRLLAHGAAGVRTVETWQAADSANIDALVLRADTEVVRLFAAATGNSDRNPAHDTLPRDQLDRALRICLRAADLAGPDPMPWVSLLTLSRLYGGGHQDSNVWWQALQARDPYNREAHHQVLRHLSARWHGSHGSMYDFAHDRASGAPDGSPLVVLLQAARAEHFRHHWESEVRGQGPGQPWRWDDGIHYELRFTMNKWIRQRRATAQDVADLNILVHALVRAGWLVAAREVFTVLGNRPTRAPWEYTGDPLADFTRWRNKLIGKI